MCRVAENLSLLTCMFPTEVEQGDTLPSCFSSHTVNELLLTVHLVLYFFNFVLLLVALLFKMGPK